MKLLASLLALTLLPTLAFAHGSRSERLNQLECAASNGVVFKTKLPTRTGIIVKTTWGLMTRDFVAEYGYAGLDSKNMVSLKDEKGEVQYVISLVIDQPEVGQSVTAIGNLYAAGNALTPFIPVASISCTLSLR